METKVAVMSLFDILLNLRSSGAVSNASEIVDDGTLMDWPASYVIVLSC